MKLRVQLITLIGVLLMSCLNTDKKLFTIPETARDGDIVLEQSTIKKGKIVLGVQKGIMYVRENRADRDSPLIALPVTRFYSFSEKPLEPIFWLQGGPGSSNMKYIPPVEFLQNHDFIRVGYRGIDGSVVLESPEIERAIRGDGKDLLSDESIQGLQRATRSMLARFQSMGLDLNNYTMSDVVDDMEAARQALGYDKINLFSASYGTRVAQVYAYLYPESLNRSFMFGVNPPGHFAYDPLVIEAKLKEYSELYDKYGPEHELPLVDMVGLALQKMPPKWLFFNLDKSKIKAITHFMLFHRGSSAMAFDAYISAYKGDYSALALMQKLYDIIFTTANVWGEFIAKGGCDYDEFIDYDARFNPPGSILGAPLTVLFFSGFSPAIQNINYNKELNRAHYSEVPTLLLSGNLDFSTPDEQAEKELLPFLKNGRHLILTDIGHCDDMETIQPAAFNEFVSSFFREGKTDSSLFKHVPMDFAVKIKLTTIVKIIIGSFCLIIPALAFGGFILIRKIMKKRSASQ